MQLAIKWTEEDATKAYLQKLSIFFRFNSNLFRTGPLTIFYPSESDQPAKEKTGYATVSLHNGAAFRSLELVT
jgi:hypothetical protein